MMKSQTRKVFGIWSGLCVMGLGCGPFFPETILGDPQGALAVPRVSYLNQLNEIAGTADSGKGVDAGNTRSLLEQIPLEVRQLGVFWETKGIEEEEIIRRSEIYTTVRTKLLKPLKDISMRDFPNHGGEDLNLNVRPIGKEFPDDVADYVEAARLYAIGDTQAARKLWKHILARPAEEKRLRALWAAWMLAKTSTDDQECMDWYARVEKEAELGGMDILGLRAAAKAWRAPRINDPVAAIHLLYDAFSQGRETAALDLRNTTSLLLSSKDTEQLERAASDPLVRRLMNLDLHAQMDNRIPMVAPESPSETGYEFWLKALEKQEDGATEGASNMAWALYSCGRYEDSKRWLNLAEKKDVQTLWLQAKFDLRDGDTERAGERLAEAIRLRSAENNWDPVHCYSEARWFDGGGELQSLSDSRLLAEMGVVSLSQGEYVAALENLTKAGYQKDAAYVAENVLSTEAFKTYVKKVAPKWLPEAGDKLGPNVRNYGRGSQYENRLRWVLARRLNREGRFQEAREFVPPDLLATFDRYVALDRARRDRTYSGEAHAAVVWEQALMHRHYGAEFFSTEGEPDGGVYRWSFPVNSWIAARTRRDGWTFDWELEKFVNSELPEHRAIPPVSPDEMIRIRKHSVDIQKRFHYRYQAAGLAWEAGKALPENHPLLARLYNTAGTWIANRDPKSADRFYKAMVQRCEDTEEGRAADKKRWFLTDLRPLESMKALPTDLRFDPETEVPW
ncbi:MAG: hypothetical protein AB8D78_03235 [Akkermansiaceae bacterium]